jgi:hypothetical protein
LSEGIDLKCENKNVKQNFYSAGFKSTLKPKVAVDWLRFQLCVRKILDSNIGQKTGYPAEGFRGFCQTLRVYAGMLWTTSDSGEDRFLPRHFQFVFNNHPATLI